MDRSRLRAALGSAAAGLLGAGLLLATVSMTANIADRWHVPVEAISGTTVAVAVLAAALVAAGVLEMALTKHRDILLLSAAAAILVLVSIVGLFSIGILVLPFAVGAIYLLSRRSAGRVGLSLPVLAGPVIAVGLSVLFVVWVQPPLVECTEGGAVTTFRPWWSTGSSSGEGSSMQSGDEDVSTGTIETPSGRYVFRCRGVELTQFRRVGGR